MTLIALSIPFILGSLITPAWGAGSDKVKRQIGVMESIIDEVLIDSPYFLVSGRDNARGLYLEGFGAVFGFDASLVTSDFWGRGLDIAFLEDWGGKVEVDEDEHGNKIITIHKGDKDKEEKAKEELKKKKKDPKEVYESGKEEMKQTMLDYGETLTFLSDDEHLVIAAFMGKMDFWKDKDRPSRMILKARMKDLRDFTGGRLSEDAAKGKIVFEEY
jgi:hypothetical protein